MLVTFCTVLLMRTVSVRFLGACLPCNSALHYFVAIFTSLTGTMHVDHVNQMFVEESNLLSRLSPILIVCALSLGKHNLLIF